MIYSYYLTLDDIPLTADGKYLLDIVDQPKERPTVNLDFEQYESLVFFARNGVKDNKKLVVDLEQWLKFIEKQNGITRYLVVVQWQEAREDPPNVALEDWPAKMRGTIEYVSRPIARVDVEKFLELKANDPVGVLVTKDPAAKVGWMTLDQMFPG